MSYKVLPGTRIQHSEFGQGAVLSVSEGFATVFFSIGGEADSTSGAVTGIKPERNCGFKIRKRMMSV